jgi:TonB family protein
MRRIVVVVSLFSAATMSVQAMASSCMPELPGSITHPVAIGAARTCLQDYPPSAVRANEEGDVMVGYFIKTDGATRSPRILRSSRYPDLDQAALRCTLRFLYKPAMRNGKPVEVPWKTRVAFRLTDFPDQLHAAGPSLPIPPLSPRRPKNAKPDPHCIPVAALSGRARA